MTAIGTDIFYAAITKTVGGFQHLKLKTVHRGIAFWMAVGSVPSAILGVWVIEILQREYGEDGSRSSCWACSAARSWSSASRRFCGRSSSRT